MFENYKGRKTAVNRNVLNLGIDLGGDTLKIAFAYDNGTEISYGKFVGTDSVLQIAVPALAFYDSVTGKWLFGDQIDAHASESFVTVVKIKSLLSIISKPQPPKPLTYKERSSLSQTRLDALREARKNEWNEKLKIWEKNKKYFRQENHFPKFYFPVSRAFLDDFSQMVELQMTFTAKGYTPYSVCEAFFHYVKKLVDERKRELEKLAGKKFLDFSISLVHPAKVGDDYVAELSNIVMKTFKCKPSKVINSNKALAQYALHRGDVKNGDSFLVFDMGEESISVAGASIINGQVAIDGADGHNDPISIGGNDIDRAVVEYLENRINDRETIGTATAGNNGHIYEGSIYAKQYLFMKDVKNAKTVFSKPMAPTSSFQRGVPITFFREIDVQRRLTRDDICTCIGVKGGKGIAVDIVNYIVDEVNRPINAKVKKIFLSGGLVETYSLLDFIKFELKKSGASVTVHTFDDGVTSGDDFKIRSHEDSVFAPAIGGAIVALKNIDVKMILSLSYGTWVGQGERFLVLFANRGSEIGPSGTKFMTPSSFSLKGTGLPEGDEIYSTPLTNAEINDLAKHNSNLRMTNAGLSIGLRDSSERTSVSKIIGLSNPPGCENARIFLMHNGRYINIENNAGVSFKEGFFVDKNGRAKPIIENADGDSRFVSVRYYASLNALNAKKADGFAQTIHASEIQAHFEGFEEIDTAN